MGYASTNTYRIYPQVGNEIWSRTASVDATATPVPRKIGFVAFLLLLVYVVVVIKIATLQSLDNSLLFGIYSVLVSTYILSRFLLAYFYSPRSNVLASAGYRPIVSFVTPAKDEGAHIAETLRAMMLSDYPSDRFEIIAINDGSSDDTSQRMHEMEYEARSRGIAMRVVDWEINRGKREGMAHGVKLARGDIVLFIDSDSFVTPSTARAMVKYFADPSIAAVAGHAEVYNAEANMLTKMQAVRYFVAFRAYKSAEAIFGSVTCCSGCCSAYRKSYVDPILDEWRAQKFLGAQCTYGDDRSLTNFLLRNGYRTIYAPEALSQTIVPDTWNKFLKQQLRWKKSWTRESLIAAMFMWKRHPLAAISFFLGIFLPLVAPIIVGRAFLWVPLSQNALPIAYLSGLVLMSMIYGIYYRLFRKDKLWVYGMFFSWFYTLVLIWQLPYAILTLRDTRWGTR